MPLIYFVQPDGSRHRIDAAADHSLMEAARAAAVPGIDADCGGAGSCATCHVHVDPAWMAAAGEANELEQAMLECVQEPGPGSRLSCQIIVSEALDGLVVRLPAQQG